MKRFFDIFFFFAYYDLLLHIVSDENTKRLQMWLNNPICGHKGGGKFPFFLARQPSRQVLPYIGKRHAVKEKEENLYGFSGARYAK